MKKRRSRAQNGTLTKIDPNSLKFKSFGISQHATNSRGRVTTIVTPVQPPVASPSEPTVFEADPLNFTKETLGDECSDDDNDIVKGYYAGSVCILCPSLSDFSSPYQDDPLLSWRAERRAFLEELTRLEGRGIFTNGKCELCRKDGEYRCVDCLAIQFLCGDCMTRVHSFDPLHVIEVS